MTKKHSKGLFVAFSIILVLLLVACFVNFTIPFSMGGKTYSYTSFVANMKLGEDIGSTYRVEYKAELREGESKTNYAALKSATMQKLKDLVQSEGYKDISVTGFDNRIILQVGDILSEDNVTEIETLIGEPAHISFYTAEKSDTTTPFATYKDVKDVSALNYYNNQTGENGFYVRVQFKDELKDKIAEETSSGGTLYIYMGDEIFSRIDLGSNAIEEGMILIQNEAFVDMNTARSYANRIKTGLLDLELTTLSKGEASPTYGNGNQIMLPIAMAIFMLIAFIYLILKYKDMGWISCFALLFFVTIGLFILQSIPLAHFNFAGLIGLLVASLIAIDSLIAIIERAKAHYEEGVELHIAFKLAQKESLMRVIVGNLVLLVAGFVSVFMPNLAISSFGWSALVLPFVSVFVSLALMRLFIKMYLSLNSTNGKKLNFHKGGKNA